MNLSWASQEMAEAEIGDERSRENLIQICNTLAAQPGIAFSRACGEAKRKAAHRLFRQRKTTPQSLLKGHIKQTALRCCQRDLPLVLAASDTTLLDFSSHTNTKGLGPIGTSPYSRGFLTHSVLAMTPDGLPLGLLHQQSYVRETPPTDLVQESMMEAESKTQRQRRKNKAKGRPYQDKESFKWLEAMQALEAALPESQPVLLLQDREADIFAFLSAPRRSNTHLLIRAAQPRRVRVQDEAGTTGSLFEIVGQALPCATYTLEVGRRPDQPARLATLEVKFLPIVIFAPQSSSQRDRSSLPQDNCIDSLPLWVVQVSETESSVADIPNAEKICWTLLCTLPVEDKERAMTLAQYYCYRWQIERFHFVLKSGCQVERLQMDSVLFLQSALSLYSVVAWWLLYLTHLCRLEPQTPAEDVLPAPLLRVVSAGENRPVKTAQDLVFALGRLGGFRRLPSAPFPGVKSLWMGLYKLHDRYQGWQLAWKSRQDAGQD